MGTSGPYDAPSSWSDLKGSITRAARTEILDGPRARSLIRSLIEHNGGRNEMAKGSRQRASGSAGSSAPARDVASRLGAFVADVRSLGFAKAVAKLGLGDLSGKPVSEILLGFWIGLAAIPAPLMKPTLDRLCRTCKRNYLPKQPM